MKCKICDFKADEGWRFCPSCGNALSSTGMFADPEIYLSFRQDNLGKITENFKSLGGMNILCPQKSKKIRKRTGDMAGINLIQLQILGCINYSHQITEDVFRAARLAGYYTIYPTTAQKDLKQLLQTIRGSSGAVWKMPADERVVDLMKKAWMKNRVGDVREVLAENGQIRYDIADVACSIRAIDSSYCTLASNICGMAEALTHTLWTGRITQCQHMDAGFCRVSIMPGDDRFTAEKLNSSDLRNQYTKLIKSIAGGRQLYPREGLGPDTHMGIHQVLNYIMLKASPGHKAVYRHSAVEAGKDLAGETGACGFDEAVDSLSKILDGLKAGRIKEADRQRIRMEEVVFSAGVDVSEKTDTFISGIIEGYLTKAMEKKTVSMETRCVSAGDPICEFTLKK